MRGTGITQLSLKDKAGCGWPQSQDPIHAVAPCFLVFGEEQKFGQGVEEKKEE